LTCVPEYAYRLDVATGDERAERVTWAQMLARRRQELGLTQRELGEAAGLSQQAVSYIERGASVPRVTTMVRLARALGTTIEALFPMEGAPHEDAQANTSV
jgi:putative transcriptional regulator